MNRRGWWVVALVVPAALVVAIGIGVTNENTSDPPSAIPSAAANPIAVAKGQVSAGWHVTRIVDGDTVEVQRATRSLTIRLIGIDTPETVHPTEPVQCFGPQASAFASRQLLREQVALEYDRSQGLTDYYGRTLAYVWVTSIARPRMFNKRAIARGYAREYTYDDDYAWQSAFRRVEEAARKHHRGLWNAC